MLSDQIGILLRDARQQLGLSQAGLARRSGVSKPHRPHPRSDAVVPRALQARKNERPAESMTQRAFGQ